MMKLTRAASYAIHALVFMANQKHNRPVASHHVAQRFSSTTLPCRLASDT